MSCSPKPPLPHIPTPPLSMPALLLITHHFHNCIDFWLNCSEYFRIGCCLTNKDKIRDWNRLDYSWHGSSFWLVSPMWRLQDWVPSLCFLKETQWVMACVRAWSDCNVRVQTFGRNRAHWKHGEAAGQVHGGHHQRRARRPDGVCRGPRREQRGGMLKDAASPVSIQGPCQGPGAVPPFSPLKFTTNTVLDQKDPEAYCG